MRKFVMMAAAVCAANLAFAAKPALDTFIAHRGESVDAPENTLPAYQTAVSRGFGFECDIYLSKDGKVFTFHDKSLTRTSGGASTNMCNDATWDEVSRLDVGNWGKWKGSKFKGTRPALLEEVLELVRDGRWLYIDVKSKTADIVPYVKEIFDRQKKANPGNTLFLCGSVECGKAFKRLMPEYKVLSCLNCCKGWKKDSPPEPVENIIAVTKEMGADGVDLRFIPDVTTAEYMKAIKDAGFELHVWTVDSLDEAVEAFRRGAQTVTTNCAKKLLDECQEAFSAIRLRKPHTDRAEIWKGLLAEFEKHREGVDEVWFSTGICFPEMSEHEAAARRLAAAADDLRRIGILPSLQIQATIGHGDAFVHYADNSGMTWNGFTAENGRVAKGCNCFRAPAFVKYMREMAALYAAAVRPYSAWIDDDIRIINHGGPGWGCHCDYCLGVFARKEGKMRTRKELVAEMKRDAALAERWRAFAFEGEAALVRAIAEAVHAASPETRMCQQQPGKCFPEHRLLYEAHHAATGLPVGMRPGAGAYLDHDARAQIGKAYTLALQMDTIGPLDFIDRICPEIESCPRSFACRTGRGVLLEALEALSQGMNSISALVMDAGFETPEWYGTEILAPLARNAAMMKRYVKTSEGAQRAGYGFTSEPPDPMKTSSLPLRPLVKDAPSALARIVTGEAARSALDAGKEPVERLLSESLLLDGAAAEAFCKAGYGERIGIARCIAVAGNLRERFLDVPANEGFKARETPVAGKTVFLKPADGAVAVSEYYSDANNAPLNLPGVAAAMFETKDGLRRVVFGHDVFGRSMNVASGDRVMQMHRLCDWASHGRSPVVLETPTRSFVQPRVRKDGTLASVVFVNASIGETQPVKMRLRGVPSGAAKAVWSALDSKDVEIPVKRAGSDALVELPSVPAWTGGYLFFL